MIIDKSLVLHLADRKTDISSALLPNTQYVPDLSSGGTFAITLDAPPSGKEARYNLILNIGNTVPAFTWPSGITWEKGSAPVFNRNTKYNLTIVDNKGSYIAYGLKQSNCLTFYAGGEQTISLSDHGGCAPYLEISTDGVNWSAWNLAAVTFGTSSVPMVYLRGKNPNGVSKSNSKWCSFVFGTAQKVGVSGNIMHLIDWEQDLMVVTPAYCFNALFSGCSPLVAVPELPATALAQGCYQSMFQYCSSLVNAQELPATALVQSCYQNMFQYCSSLVNAPELPATTLAQSCYQNMFYGCSSLVNAPELPATTLAQSCYQDMFYECSSLVNAPELPATTLAQGCYQLMFYKCSSLTSIKCLAEDLSATNCIQDWMLHVKSVGTFTKKAGVTYPSGASGIPSGWTVVEV